MAKKLPPTHPGEVLLEEFLVPPGISQYRLAKDYLGRVCEERAAALAAFEASLAD